MTVTLVSRRTAAIWLACRGAERTAADDTPLTVRLEQAFAARLADLDEQTRTLLLLAALQDNDSLADTMRAAALLVGHGLPIDAFRAAIEAGLATRTG